ncbi:MAG: radical SAM family heme chaperone HemW [Gemmatimonadaceae bacterium]|nr:radical SAM family heme chaperone HemW [Gemmatimonadaceae bacterium]
MNPRHLYIHVPFCARRCVYCDFSIAVRRITPVDEYIAALRAELSTHERGGDWNLDTVYLGGGTPSRLGATGIAEVLDLVREHAKIEPTAEVTIEANPEDVTLATAGAWRAAGVNRVSLGVQSFNDEVLKWMHRSHTGADAESALRALRGAGINNVSIDLIFALPEALRRVWLDDLTRAIALDPPHISVYGLAVEPATPLSRWVSAKSVKPLDEDPYAEEFLTADKMLSGAGYSHYEVSNYAREGMRSQHNSSYWSGAEYLGLGPSAHSLIGNERRWNVRNYAEWQTLALSGESVVAGSEILTDELRSLESIYLGLRTSSGYHRRGTDTDRVNRWVSAGWCSVAEDVVKLNASGWLRLDALAADLGGTSSGRNYISSHGSSAA